MNQFLLCVYYLRTITTGSVSISIRIHAAESLGRRRRYAESALFLRETYPVVPSTWLSNLELNWVETKKSMNKRLHEWQRANQIVHTQKYCFPMFIVCAISLILTEDLDSWKKTTSQFGPLPHKWR